MSCLQRAAAASLLLLLGRQACAQPPCSPGAGCDAADEDAALLQMRHRSLGAHEALQLEVPGPCAGVPGYPSLGGRSFPLVISVFGQLYRKPNAAADSATVAKLATNLTFYNQTDELGNQNATGRYVQMAVAGLGGRLLYGLCAFWERLALTCVESGLGRFFVEFVFDRSALDAATCAPSRFLLDHGYGAVDGWVLAWSGWAGAGAAPAPAGGGCARLALGGRAYNWTYRNVSCGTGNLAAVDVGSINYVSTWFNQVDLEGAASPAGRLLQLHTTGPDDFYSLCVFRGAHGDVACVSAEMGLPIDRFKAAKDAVMTG